MADSNFASLSISGRESHGPRVYMVPMDTLDLAKDSETGHYSCVKVFTSESIVVNFPAPTDVFEPFVFVDKPTVDAFLARHSVLTPVLPELRTKVDEFFSPQNPIKVSVFESREDEGDRSLYALIQFFGPPREGIDKMTRLESAWWFRHPASDSGLMVVDVETR